MSIRHSCLVAFAVAWCFGPAAKAQAIVPGGWSAQFGYQGLGNGSFGAMTPGVYGGGLAGWGGSPFGSAQGFAYGPGSSPYAQGTRSAYLGTMNGFAPAPATVNAIDPLIGSIRQATRRPRR